MAIPRRLLSRKNLMPGAPVEEADATMNDYAPRGASGGQFELAGNEQRQKRHDLFHQGKFLRHRKGSVVIGEDDGG